MSDKIMFLVNADDLPEEIEAESLADAEREVLNHISILDTKEVEE